MFPSPSSPLSRAMASSARTMDFPGGLSSDMKRFKALTMGKPLVMGRKTYLSIPRALPGRETIVVTRDPAYRPGGRPHRP